MRSESAPFPARIFREYDIRGRADTELSESLARDIGRALGTLFLERQERAANVGRDCRLSSPRLHAALVEGLLSTGVDVFDLGECPTPLMYFSLHHTPRTAGVIVTGSHNPGEDNGVKICSRGASLYGEDIKTLRRLIESQSFAQGAGQRFATEIIAPYQEFCRSKIQFARPLRVVVDAGNGTAGPVIVPLLRAMGVEVHALFCEPDGRFPNHHPDPTVPENMEALSAAVVAHQADVGLAFDGDSDRLGAVVLERGAARILWGDDLMILFAREVLQENPGAAILGEVKCSQVLFDEVAKRGGRPVLWKTGHSLIKAKMRAEGILLAGEMSGHLFFADRYFGYDDAIYAGLRLLSLASRLPPSTEEGTSSLALSLRDVPAMFATPELRVDCPDEQKFSLVERVKANLRARFSINDVDGVRVSVPGGWGLVRASNTQPILVLRAEGDSPRKRDEILALLHATIDASRS
jgi:phosphomannomutase/phosphoglucomutase